MTGPEAEAVVEAYKAKPEPKPIPAQVPDILNTPYINPSQLV